MEINELKKETTVGPKGQVVVPLIFREIMGIHPKDTVIFVLKNNQLIVEKPNKKSIEIFKKIAASAPKIKKITLNKHNEELEKRWSKIKKQ